MTEQHYDIYFRGEIKNGFELAKVKANVSQLFKTTPEKVDQLFSGKLVALKKDLDKTTAAKFKQVLENAGVIIYVKMVANAVNSEVSSAKNPNTSVVVPSTPATSIKPPITASVSSIISSPIVEENDNSPPPMPEVSIEEDETEEIIDFQILPAGSAVLREDEREVVTAPIIDISGIRLKSVFDSNELPQDPVPPPPNISHLSTAKVGADILEGYKPPPPPPPPSVDHISLAAAEADLAAMINDLFVPAPPDVSHITTAKVGADILEGYKSAPPPPAPDVSHIKLVN